MSSPLTLPDRRAVLVGAAGLASLGLAPQALAKRTDPIVRTRHGPVLGLREGGQLVFKGVRYGADTGPRRFQPPLPPAPWTRPLPCTAFGHASLQRGKEADQSEDCLFLNVWTPRLDGPRRPVMVWIHGGGFRSGSGNIAGEALAKEGVVVVSMNFRLGPLGLIHPSFMGGEYLPNRQEAEVEIARINIDSTTQAAIYD
jgi:para-nitrobenzyl esterase